MQSQVRLNRVAEKGCGEGLVESQVKFNSVPEKVLEKVWEALAWPGQVPKKVPEKVLGGFGAKPDQVQQGSGEGSGRLW